MYWLVFNKQTTPAAMAGGPNFGGMHAVAPEFTEVKIVPAIFRAACAEDACRAAAKKMGAVGTYFAVEGTPWGVEMLDVEGVEELGAEPSETDEKERRIRALERTVLDREDLPA